jgi:hypothetical protein
MQGNGKTSHVSSSSSSSSSVILVGNAHFLYNTDRHKTVLAKTMPESVEEVQEITR